MTSEQRENYTNHPDEASHVTLVVPPLPLNVQSSHATSEALDMEAQIQGLDTIVNRAARHYNLMELLQAVQRFRPSPMMVYLFATISSLSLALWWTISHNDISGGFTMGAYVWEVIIFPTGYWHWAMSKTRTVRSD